MTRRPAGSMRQRAQRAIDVTQTALVVLMIVVAVAWLLLHIGDRAPSWIEGVLWTTVIASVFFQILDLVLGAFAREGEAP